MSENNPKNDVSSLPESWIKPKLSDVITIEKGRKPKVLENLPSNLAYPYINIEAFEKGIYTQYTDGEGATLSNFGDVLIVWDGARCGLVGKGVIGAVGSTLARLFSSGVNNLYLFYFLQSMFSFINSRPRGVGIPHVDPGLFWNIDFPLAPLSEQHRIVAKIEELFTQLDAAESALKHTKAKLERYRQSVLQAAVTGSLVPQYHSGETAEEMLKRIYPGWVSPIGKDGTKTFSVSDNLPSLPPGWCWATIDQLCDVKTGATPLRSNNNYYIDGQIPWVTSGSLNSLYVDRPDGLITELAIKETNAKIIPSGSLLIAMYGEGKTRGKVSELKINAAINQAIAALVFSDKSSVLKPYIKIFLQKNYDEIRLLASGGVQPNLNLSIIKNTFIPIPPINELQQIVLEIDRITTIIERLFIFTLNALTGISRLRQSILRKAYEGRLLDQYPEDEPASILLQRIQAERQDTEKQKAAKPKKEKKKLTKETKRRSLFETLQTAGKRLTPEELFKRAGFTEESVDEFYAELRQELQIEVDGRVVKPGRIKEERPNQAYIYLSEVKS